MGLLSGLTYAMASSGSSLTGQTTLHSSVLDVGTGGVVLTEFYRECARGRNEIQFRSQSLHHRLGRFGLGVVWYGLEWDDQRLVHHPSVSNFFRGSGQIQVFSNGGDITGAPTTPTTLGGTTAKSQMHHFHVVCTDPNDGNPFDGSGTTKIDVYQDGYKIYTTSLAGSLFTSSYVSLGSCASSVAGGYSEFDNFQVFGNAASVTTPNRMGTDRQRHLGWKHHGQLDQRHRQRLPFQAGDVARSTARSLPPARSQSPPG